MFLLNMARGETIYFLSGKVIYHDDTISSSHLTLCILIHKPLVVYIFSNIM